MDAWVSFFSGPTSDHFNGGFGSWPLNLWKVVIPIPGFTSTSLISFGRTTTTLRCATARSTNKSAKSNRATKRPRLETGWSEGKNNLHSDIHAPQLPLGSRLLFVMQRIGRKRVRALSSKEAASARCDYHELFPGFLA